MLDLLGVEFDVVTPAVDEIAEGDPESAVVENARRKAHAGRRALGTGMVLGVDTDVAIDGRLLGKPRDEAEAARHLRSLEGRTHTVLSGVVVLDTALESSIPVERSALARTDVTFAELTEETVELYLASGEWRDRAGGYAIQGLGSILIERIEGDFSNVVGLPVPTLLELIPDLLD